MHEYLQFAAHNWPLVTALAIVGVLIVADELHRRVRGASELEPTAAVALINRGALVVDCRKAEEHAAGHITGSRHIPLAELEQHSSELKRKKAKPILAVAANAREASQAINTLRRAGFEAVFVIKGGLAAWVKQHLPLEKN
ncbi:MAG: rhodanese-like domain-containing protein [Gammaproteobacteria bacterium]